MTKKAKAEFECVCGSANATCTPICDYCWHCSHAYWQGEGAGHRWEYNPMHGPRFTGRRARPKPSSLACRLFDAWFEKWQVARDRADRERTEKELSLVSDILSHATNTHADKPIVGLQAWADSFREDPHGRPDLFEPRIFDPCQLCMHLHRPEKECEQCRYYAM